MYKKNVTVIFLGKIGFEVLSNYALLCPEKPPNIQKIHMDKLQNRFTFVEY